MSNIETGFQHERIFGVASSRNVRQGPPESSLKAYSETRLIKSSLETSGTTDHRFLERERAFEGRAEKDGFSNAVVRVFSSPRIGDPVGTDVRTHNWIWPSIVLAIGIFGLLMYFGFLTTLLVNVLTWIGIPHDIANWIWAPFGFLAAAITYYSTKE